MNVITAAVSPKTTTTKIPLLQRNRRSFSSTTAIIAVIAAAVIVAVMFLAPVPREFIGFLTLLLVFDLLLLNIHVGVSMICASAAGLLALGGPNAIVGTLKTAAFQGTASWSLSVIPMFILMGIILWRGGVTASAYATARQWLGRLPGGLAVATNLAGSGLAASSGSTIGMVNALGRMALPEMLKAGYRPSLSTGVVVSVGTLGQIIPPSIMMVIYAGVMQTPVGPQLLAGIVPGVILAVLFTLLIMGIAIVRPSAAPKLVDPSITWRTRFRSVPAILPLTAVVIIVIGGLLTGVFTATEAGAFGVLAAFLASVVSMWKKRLTFRNWVSFIMQCSITAVVSSAAIFLLLIGITLLTRVIALSFLAQGLARWISSLGLSSVGLLLLLLVVYLVLGMFIETLSMMMLTLPVLAPVLAAADVDLVWFGVFMVILVEVGQLTPPLGILAFIAHRIASDPEVNGGTRVSLGSVFAGVMPFVVVTVLFCIALIFLPELATWLPTVTGVQ